MKFVIANTFQNVLQRLEGKDAAEAKLAKQAAFDFQMNLSQTGFSFERLNKSKDPNFWFLGVNDNIRIIGHRVPDIGYDAGLLPLRSVLDGVVKVADQGSFVEQERKSFLCRGDPSEGTGARHALGPPQPIPPQTYGLVPLQ